MNQINKKEAAELFRLRSAGTLPHIDINGTDFTIDWRLKELRETASPWNNINLKNMEMSRSGEQYLCFYDTVNHREWDFDPDITAPPENVVLLEIPYEVKLDPYAVAREYGIDPAEFISDYPIEKNLVGILKPLTESGLPQVIAENLQKLGQGLSAGQQSDDQDYTGNRKIGR
ncbi:hypothetical protein J7E50_02620 [Pedobacter sp. ISL-68]|uniref:hypothetical protein n=1 Tax=unclassified Pedobacter TaxID=2628915 RepID=UPI001BE954BB|nr:MULTISPECIES: hypothetical protein [unclassified Pedobacter]MBT2560115.1 hypothetical protein [Pedobacter sp. ISL-64]MBT2589094.1 hypothetical protein [Pedobacter sp. ISL-68]